MFKSFIQDYLHREDLANHFLKVGTVTSDCSVLQCLVIFFHMVYSDYWCFPGDSDSKASVYNVRDLGSIPGLGRFPSPGDLPNPGIKPRSPTLQVNSLPSEPLGKPTGRKGRKSLQSCPTL